MSRIWVLVADSTRARIFAAKSPVAAIEEVHEMQHPEGRLHQQDLSSDRPGRDFDAQGSGSHAMDMEVDPKMQEAIDFAKKINQFLESACNQNKFDRLIIVSGPTFLGLLRDNMSTLVTKFVSREIDKNVVQMREDEIRKHLPEWL